MDIDHNQCPQSDSGLFGQLPSNEGYDIGELVLQLLVVLFNPLRTISNCFVNLLSPEDLTDTDYYLSWPLADPVDSFCDWIGLGGREGGEGGGEGGREGGRGRGCEGRREGGCEGGREGERSLVK